MFIEIKNAILMYLLWRKRRTLSQTHTLKKSRKRGRLWVRPLFTQEARARFGAGGNLIAEMRLNISNKHDNFFRMNSECFDELLKLVTPHVEKVDIRREPISARTRLAITLRYLAAGDSMTSLSYLFRVGVSTVSEIVSETTQVIWTVLQPIVLRPPSEQDWLKISQGFERTWQFPNCIGAIDGKHVKIQVIPRHLQTLEASFLIIKEIFQWF